MLLPPTQNFFIIALALSHTHGHCIKKNMARRLSIPDFAAGIQSSSHSSHGATDASPTVDALNKNGWKAFSKNIFRDFGSKWDTCIMFQSNGTTVYTNCDVHSGELTALVENCDNRDNVIQKGFQLQGNSYDVHQFCPPFWWGRIGVKKESKIANTGIALCRVSIPNADVLDLFVLIAYKLPCVSAFAVNRLQAFKDMLETACTQ